MTQIELARRLNIVRSNITVWKLMRRVPKTRKQQLKEIKDELIKKSK